MLIRRGGYTMDVGLTIAEFMDIFQTHDKINQAQYENVIKFINNN